MIIHNCHIHTLTDKHVPRNFLPFGLVRFLARHAVTRRLAGLLHNLFPFSDSDLFDRYARFITIGTKGSQKKIFNEIRKFYPAQTSFVIHSMDLEYMGAGKVKVPYVRQLEELALLKAEYGDTVLPFVFADPRRPDLPGLVTRFIEKHNFSGVKIYPALGYFPHDKRLYPVYEYCQKKKIPVTAHTSRGGIYFRGKIKDSMFSGSSIPVPEFKSKKRGETCSFFSHPAHYKEVLKDFPKLKICFAHFGGDEEWNSFFDSPDVDEKKQEDINRNWLSLIVEMMETYPTLYADVSYTMHRQRFRSLLKVLLQNRKLKKKILFGSDYYMVQRDTTERTFSIELRAFLGDDLYKQIAETNPVQFGL